jgi:hypothetical protein
VEYNISHIPPHGEVQSGKVGFAISEPRLQPQLTVAILDTHTKIPTSDLQLPASAQIAVHLRSCPAGSDDSQLTAHIVGAVLAMTIRHQIHCELSPYCTLCREELPEPPYVFGRGGEEFLRTWNRKFLASKLFLTCTIPFMV